MTIEDRKLLLSMAEAIYNLEAEAARNRWEFRCEDLAGVVEEVVEALAGIEDKLRGLSKELEKLRTQSEIGKRVISPRKRTH